MTQDVSSARPPSLRRALNDVTFHVAPGERVGIVGLNGAGKTTLFRTIAGILRPTHGSVFIDGLPVFSPQRPPIGFMAVRPLVYRWLTGYENLRFIASLYGIPDADARIEELAERMSLLDRLHTYVEQYSSGMVARLDLARVLLPKPRVLFLDEPFGSFDIRFSDEARSIIQESGATVLMATHNIFDIEKLTRRLLLLHDGLLLRDIRFDELSEVSPVERGKPVSIAEFVNNLLRHSLPAESPRKPLHRRHVLPG